MANSLEYIYNFLQLTPKIGTAGQPTREQFTDIQESQYQLVVNLLPEKTTKYLPEEKEIVESYGMDYVQIPVLWEHPTLADLQRFFEVMDGNKEKNIFVHCAANMRVSVFLYLYRRLKEGISEEEAREDLEKIWIPNQVWQKFIDEVMESFN
ncbi:MAG TPA: protein tyrosine phosphatase family protein [Nostocaceae cyanobacterium]|nr:protein tyrosine phosphatase family protein [Nostocaceae cyanobacterium]